MLDFSNPRRGDRHPQDAAVRQAPGDVEEVPAAPSPTTRRDWPKPFSRASRTSGRFAWFSMGGDVRGQQVGVVLDAAVRRDERDPALESRGGPAQQCVPRGRVSGGRARKIVRKSSSSRAIRSVARSSAARRIVASETNTRTQRAASREDGEEDGEAGAELMEP